jgi:hypothetical protein
VSLISKPNRPMFLDIDNHSLNTSYDKEVERELHFNDIMITALDIKENSRSIIELIKLMRNEIQSKYFDNKEKELNYRELYKIFV